MVGLPFIPIGLVCLYLFIDGYQPSQLINILPKLLMSAAGAAMLSYFMYDKAYAKKIKAVKERIKAVKDFRDPA